MPGVVKVYTRLHSEAEVRQANVLFYFDGIIFQRPAERSYPNIVSVHTDLNAIVPKFLHKLRTSKLVPLIRIKNLRFSVGIHCHCQRLNTKKSVHCIHYIGSPNLATEPDEDSYHKCLMSSDCRVGDIRAPYLIRTLYLAFAQKIWEFLMFRMWFRGIEMRTQIDRLQIQVFLLPAHSFMIHSVSAAFQSAVKRGTP